MNDRPLVSIGVPVYNGAAHVEDALKTLMAQDYPSLEILISDNASTDETASVCRRLAEQDPRIQYACNAENIGPMPNFLRVLERSRGQYFMWAAHDDIWAPTFVPALVQALQSQPEAVLATPKTVYLRADGTPSVLPDDRPAPAGAPLEKLRVFLDDDAAGWLYGLYRRDWLARYAHELHTAGYPVWGGDIMWLVSVVLRFPVVGSAEATIYKRVKPSSFAPKCEAEFIRFALEMLRQLTAIARRCPTQRSEQQAATRLVRRYVYRQHFRRRTPLKTLRRMLRLPLSLAQIGVRRAGSPRPQSGRGAGGEGGGKRSVAGG